MEGNLWRLCRVTEDVSSLSLHSHKKSGFSPSFDWHLYRYKGGDGDGRKERSRCFNLGLGDNHCYNSSSGRRVHHILEAIRPDAENESLRETARIIWKGKGYRVWHVFDAMKSNTWNKEVLCLLFGL